jgi:alginate O-acetyltransferase complex protein AlgI
LLFLPVVVLLYWISPSKLRPIWLLAASYYFYMSWLRSYGLLLFSLTAVNYLIGLALYRAQRPNLKRLVLIAGLAANLSTLAVFKYTNFIIDSVCQTMAFLKPVLAPLAVPAFNHTTIAIVLPLGISFFVFEFIHYLVDIYRGNKPIFSPIRFGLFAAFFPSQIAGPIKRYEDFDAQLDTPQKFDLAFFESGLWLIIQGMFKKVALGDNLAILVQQGFKTPAAMGTLDAWVCVIAFAFQIYFDFSGYTDIGRGSAMLLGFRLPENFNLPYLATNLRDFWHRWHISLSTWLRDYLYIPLGGSRKGSATAMSNLLVTMLLGGLWHGAAWHYVIWGGFHGAGLAVTHMVEKIFKPKPIPIVGPVVTRLFTFFLVIIGWVVFRADDMQQALGVYQGMFSWRASAEPLESITLMYLQSTLFFALPAYGLLQLVVWYFKTHEIGWLAKPAANWKEAVWWLQPPLAARVVFMAGASFLVLGFASLKSMPFIYFQF